MNASYVIAVMATRLLGLLLLLVLFHLLPGSEFGSFALINTNAMSIYMVCGAWVIAIGNRTLVTDGNTVDRAMLSAVAFALLGIFTLLLMVGVTLHVVTAPADSPILLTAGLAAVLTIYEATLASKNALGRAKAYAIIAVSRNVLALVLAVGLVAVGAGVTGAVAGIGISALLAIVAQPDGRRLWSDVRYRSKVLAPLKPYIAFGIGGALQLGSYILVNAPLRNLIAIKYGTAAAGIWSVTTDLYFGPLALVANANALSQVRLIYLAASNKETEVMWDRCRALLEFTVVIAALYAVGSIFFATDAARLVAPADSVADVVAIAIPAALFGVAIMVLYSLVTVALVGAQIGLVALMIATVAAASSVPLLWSNTLLEGCWQAAIGANTIVLCWSIFVVVNYRLFIPLGQLVRLGVAVAGFVLVAVAGGRIFSFGLAWLAIATVATATFLAAGLLVRINAVTAALSASLRMRR